jgi:gliding motility-associated-like protein
MWVSPNTTTTYIVTGSNVDGCQNSETVTVTVNPMPTTQLLASDNSVCPNETVVLNASGATTYNWTGIDLTGFTGNVQSIIALNSGWYTIIGTTQFGCTTSDSTWIDVNPKPVISVIPVLSEVCIGNPISITASGATYFWSNGNTAANFSDFPTQSETLTIIGFNAFGCSDTIQANVVVHPNPLASIGVTNGNLQSDNPVATFLNNSINQVNSTWNFGDGTTITDNGQEVLHTFPMEDGSYTVSLVVASDYGCLDSATIGIQVSGDPIYYVPNTFTPDGDEHNNVFQPIFTSGYDPTDFRLLIYDRWGEIIFESLSPEEGWPGYYGGLKVPAGTYSYTIMYFDKKENRLKEFQGHVNVIY